MRSGLVAAALLIIAAPSWAADLLMPDPALSPAEVVSILQANDTPQTDAGIAQTWAFAHPDNKRVSGTGRPASHPTCSPRSSGSQS